MKLKADDDIYRFSAVLIEIRGWKLPVVARYVVWFAWFLIFMPTLFITAVLTPFNVVTTLLVAIVVSATVTYFFVAERITAENTFDAVLSSFASELQSWGIVNRRKKVERKEHPTVTGEGWLDGLTVQPDPTWNVTKWFKKGS